MPRSACHHPCPHPRRLPALAAAVLALASAVGCSTPRADPRVLSLTERGDFGRARSALATGASRDPADRAFMLQRTNLLALALAEGLPEAAEPIADRLYDFLRTQDVNADTGVASFLFGEGNARIWKGEPFEQAYTLASIGILDGLQGDWGNVRASASSALFQVRDFSRTLSARTDGKRVRHANPSDDSLAAREDLLANAPSDDLAGTFTLARSDFELAYILKAIAARQIGAPDADEALAQLVQVAPRLQGLADTIRAGQYNTILVVEFGLAPEKYATGPDNAIAAFRPRTPSSDAPLRVRLQSGPDLALVPVATDLNRLARDLRWNSLEDLRKAKSAIGTGLLVGGAVLAASSDNRNAQLVGLGLLLAGALAKATSAADTRHAELLPQRVYVAPVALPSDPSAVEIQIDGRPDTRMVLAGLAPPPPGQLALHHVRIPAAPAPWATSGAIAYANDESGPTSGPQLPWILGGRCLRTPSYPVLASYQASGFLKNFSLNDLLDLYREEGIEIAGLSTKGEIGRHILEGGSWLYSPRAGSTGFARLFGIDHPPYQPKSARVRDLAAQCRAAMQQPPRN